MKKIVWIVGGLVVVIGVVLLIEKGSADEFKNKGFCERKTEGRNDTF